MATTETRVFLFNAPGSALPDEGETGVLGINLYEPAIVAAYGEGWRSVSHTLSQLADGRLLVSILAERVSDVPDDATSLTTQGER